MRGLQRDVLQAEWRAAAVAGTGSGGEQKHELMLRLSLRSGAAPQGMLAHRPAVCSTPQETL